MTTPIAERVARPTAELALAISRISTNHDVER
jgi:hypothetical protein